MSLPAVNPVFAAIRQTRIELRDYQQDLKDRVTAAWQTDPNVLAVLPVGGGKTVILSSLVSDERGASCVIAHRQELVTQISLALARFGIRHRIIAPAPVIRGIVRVHIREVGYSFHDAGATAGVASVDSLVARKDKVAGWCAQVRLWVQDEAHHILRKNKWGKAAELFPNARGLGVTATPERADGKGLGRDAAGLFDVIVEGPKLRDLIWLGWLTDYRIYAPPPSIVMRDEDVGSSGDYTQPKLAAASKKSQVVGDVVAHYRRYASGLRGITFATDLETSGKIARAYDAAGVPARAVDGTSHDDFRAESVEMLRRGELLELVNVDLFGEGFDLPAIAVVSDARPTKSFPRFVQAIGRMLRPEYAEGWPRDTPEQRRAAIAAGPKPFGTYIDHVGNVREHAVARECDYTGELVIDVCYREWSLEGRPPSGRKVARDLELTTCTACYLPYAAFKPICPYCQAKPEPAGRSAPEFVDGDLTELDPAVLTRIHSEINRIDGAPQIPRNANAIVAGSIKKQHIERQKAQGELRESMALWAGAEKHAGRPDAERYRLFYRLFGIDAATAQTLGAREARELANKIMVKLWT